ncbi:STAS domain-containing protein, partial [Streptomyces collinus]|uniref:STAS domain-containing protein n=1 Tax=Streptomyces collinus TaxID=42684 RepID=UPI00368818DA
ALTACLDEPTHTLLLDLTGITFCDNTGLHTLNHLTHTLHHAHITLRLTGISPHLKRTLTHHTTPPTRTPLTHPR